MLDSDLVRCRAIVNLGAVAENYRRLTRRTGTLTTLLCVVKADAYGHGALPVARTLEASGAGHFAVASLEEAIELRDGGIAGEVLVLGGVACGEERETAHWRILPLVGSIPQLRNWAAEARRTGRRLPCHLLLNTGLNRLGIDFEAPDGPGTQELLDAIAGCEGVEIRGVATHFACSEDFRSGLFLRQAQLFQAQLAVLRQAGVAPRYVHADNSASLVYRGVTVPCGRGTVAMARPGLALYGYVSAPIGRDRNPCEERLVRPVLEWRARLMAVRNTPAGAPLGYGATFETRRPMRVGVLSVGYGDGLDWRLSNRGAVSIGGSRCPIVGRVSMDLTIVDLAGAPDARIGDEAVLMGEDPYDAEGMAALTGTLPYELLCRISARVPRQYIGPCS